MSLQGQPEVLQVRFDHHLSTAVTPFETRKEQPAYLAHISLPERLNAYGRPSHLAASAVKPPGTVARLPAGTKAHLQRSILLLLLIRSHFATPRYHAYASLHLVDFDLDQRTLDGCRPAPRRLSLELGGSASASCGKTRLQACKSRSP